MNVLVKGILCSFVRSRASQFLKRDYSYDAQAINISIVETSLMESYTKNKLFLNHDL